jgi:Flp pilus assembly protein TadD
MKPKDSIYDLIIAAFCGCVVLLTLCVACSAPSSKDDAGEAALRRLDHVLSMRQHYMNVKEKRLKTLTQQYLRADDSLRLRLSTQLFHEYYTYRFDSAMHYTLLEQSLARQMGDKRALDRAKMHTAMIFTIGGYYSEAERLLDSVSVDPADKQAVYDYYFIAYSMYNYWSDYCRDQLFSPEYDRRKLACLSMALRHYPRKHDAQYDYLLGEQAFFSKKPLSESTRYYRRAVAATPSNTRLYASAAYALARNCRLEGKESEYEQWLIRSAMADQIIPLKENLALQELAMHLFEKDKDNAEKSTYYIYCSMEDAHFYNNRLRMLEISRRLPSIVSVYQQQINSKRDVVTSLSMGLGLFVLMLIIGIVYIMRQAGKLNKRGLEIDRKNKELALLNERLRKTDETRGRYMRLFMDLCANYIDKMTNFRKLVVRKVKAHQTDDLIHTATSSKLSGNEALQFYAQFDKAFMELYPSFVEEFNALLRPECQLQLARDGSLTTEMRIYALVRLGVGESVEIATLLFYSPQTIYNYRTAMRKRALHPETFEDDVRALH